MAKVCPTCGAGLFKPLEKRAEYCSSCITNFIFDLEGTKAPHMVVLPFEDFLEIWDARQAELKKEENK
jgi:uncharacterized protein (DUF983 family)